MNRFKNKEKVLSVLLILSIFFSFVPFASYADGLSNYKEDYATSTGENFTPASTRVVKINCPIDVEVYNSKNALVVSIIDDEPQDIPESSIIL